MSHATHRWFSSIATLSRTRRCAFVLCFVCLTYPIERGEIKRLDDMAAVWRHSFEQLCVEASEHPVRAGRAVLFLASANGLIFVPSLHAAFSRQLLALSLLAGPHPHFTPASARLPRNRCCSPNHRLSPNASASASRRLCSRRLEHQRCIFVPPAQLALFMRPAARRALL